MRCFAWQRLGQRKGSGSLQTALITTLGLFVSGGLGLGADTDLAAQENLDAPKKRPSLADLINTPIPIIAGASKFPQPITRAPSSVTVITADEIKLYGYRTLAEILQSAPGLYTTYDRNYSYLGTRGFNRGDYNSRVLVLVDGHRLNNNLSDGGAIGTEFILDVDLIEQVEVVRGPVATLYGNNAFFGIINVITRKGGSLPGYGAEASGQAGSLDTYQGRVTWGHRFTNSLDGLELLLSGSLSDSEGQDRLYYKEFDAPPASDGIAHNGDYGSSKSVFGTIAWRDFTLEGAFITREKGNPTAQYYTAFNDSRFRTTDDRGYVNLAFAHDFPDVVKVDAKLYYDRYELELDQPFDPALGVNREQQVGEWWGAELQLTKQLFDRHTLIFGGEYRDDFHQERRNYDVDPYFEYARVQSDTFNYGVYLQGDFAIVTNLHLNAGVRYDQYGDLDPTANPRAALIYNPFPRSTLKAIYGSAFRAPNFFERAFNAGVFDLAPETITTYELVYEQGIVEKREVSLRSSLSLFYNQIDDLITLAPHVDSEGNVSSIYQNLEGAEALGVEAGLEGRWTSGLRGRISYTFAETKDRATDQRLTDSPRHLAKLNVSVPVVKEKLFANLEVQYASERTSVAGPVAGGFGVINFTLFSQKLVKGLEVSASVYNLLDRQYSDPATPFHQQALIEQDGRSFRVKVTYRF